MDQEKWIGVSKTFWGNFTTLIIALGAVAQVDTPSPDEFQAMGLTLEQLIADAFAIGTFLLGLYGRWKAKVGVWFFKKPKTPVA